MIESIFSTTEATISVQNFLICIGVAIVLGICIGVTHKLTTKTKKIHRNKYFVETLKDKNGKAIKKTKVKIKLNGKTYTRTTNNKGVVKLKVSVKIGTYKIKTSFKSTKLYGATVFTNKIKVIK